MSTQLHTWEYGSDGDNTTTSDPGNGDTPWSSAPGTLEIDTGVASPRGGRTGRLPSGATAITRRWYSLATNVYAFSTEVRFASVAPSATVLIAQIRTSADGNIGSITLATNGRIAARHGTTDINNVANFAISANNWYRIDVIWTIDPANANQGRLQYRVVDINSDPLNNTPIASGAATYDSGATLTLGTSQIDRIYAAGTASTSTRNGDYNYGIIRGETGKTTFFDAYNPAAPIAETLTDNLALLEATDGTPPFTIAQDSGTTTTPEELDDGAVSGTGRWLVAKHSADTLVYTVTDAAAEESDPYNVPPISPANSFIKRPTGSLPSTTWE